MKDYPECEYCRLKDDEPHCCDICDDADMFEPYDDEGDELFSANKRIPIAVAA